MTRPPYSFSHENRHEIERRASERAQKPLAEPIAGGVTVAIGSFFVAQLTLGLSDTIISDHRVEGIGNWVALICGVITYLVLRAQSRKHDNEVSRVAADLWEMRQPKEKAKDLNIG